MNYSIICNANIQKQILDSIKVPHSTSYPVIYKENEKYYLAVFVFFYSREDIESGMAERPIMWAIADIETGKIIEKRLTKDKDFSSASYNVKYSIRTDKQCDTSIWYYSDAFKILDSVRTQLRQKDELDNVKYKMYLDKIIANVPTGYRRFYRDLSI